MESSDQKKLKAAIWFSINNDMRFLSHLDTMQVFQRAFLRMQLPLKYSNGFNPRMRISLPLPRSVAMASQKELLLLGLTEDIDLKQMLSSLASQLPEGITPIHADYVPIKAKALPTWASYNIHLKDKADKKALAQQIEKFANSEQWIITREAHGKHPQKDLDLKHFFENIALNNNCISCTINIKETTTARVSEAVLMLQLDSTEHIDYIERIDAGYPKEFSIAS